MTMTSKQVFVRRVLAVVLSLILVFGALPVSAVEAETEHETSNNVTEAYETPEETPQETDNVADSVANAEEGIAPVGSNTLENGYYLTGSLSAYSNEPSWYWTSSIKELLFTKNTLADGEEYMLKGVKLKEKDEFKVVKIENDEIKQWYPDPDTDSKYENIVAEKDGTFTLYFRPTSKDEWELGSGHLYMEEEESTEEPDPTEDSTEPETDEDVTEPTTGSETPDSTEPESEESKDKEAPIIKSAVYSNAENGEQKWVSASETVKLTLELKDESDIVSFKIGDKDVTPEIDGDEYTFTLSAKGKVQKNSVTIKIEDSEGNVAEYKTEPLLIDGKVPKASDVKTGAFEKGTTATSQVLNTLSFGLYSNDALNFTVAVSANGGSPITDIKVADGKNELSGGEVTKDEKSNLYLKTFKLPIKNDKPYDLAVTEITDEVGHTYSDKINVLDLQLTADKKSLQVSDKLFELVASSLAPSTKIQVKSGSKNKGIYRGKVSGTAEIRDSLNGIKDNGIEIYFDTAEKIANVKNNDYSGIKKLDKNDYKVENVRGSLEDETGKLVGKNVSFTINDSVESGSYFLLVAATGNNGNTSYSQYSLRINNTKLVITDVKYDKGWSNKPVNVSFKINDAPAAVSVGVKSIGIVDSDNKAVTDYKKSADGIYSFEAAKNTTYKITATDNFGDTSEAVEAKISYDDKAPVIKNVTYSNNANKDWATDVTISFKVEDDLSSVEKDKIVVTGEDGNKVAANDIKSTDAEGVYSFKATKAQKYTITATDKAKNDSTAVETESVKYDPSKAIIKKVVFREVSAADVKAFGIYKNAPIAMEVYVSAEGDAEVSDISVLNDETPLETEGKLTFVSKQNMYVKKFPIPKLDDSAYKFTFKAKKSNGTESVLTGFKDLEVYVSSHKLMSILPEFFEVVISEEKPIINNFDAVINKEESDGKYRGNAGYLTATISDSLAGIDIKTLKATVNGTDITECITKESDTREESGKLTERVIKYNFRNSKAPITNEGGVIPTGEYTFEFKVKNNAGNEQTAAFVMKVDNTAPALDETSYSFNGKKKMTEDDWSKKPIVVEFKADDADDSGVSAGIDASCIEVTGKYAGENQNADDKTYTVSAVEGKADTYSFNADLKQDYTIVITDKIGNVSETYTIDNSKVLYDDEAPVMNGEFLYDGVSFDKSAWKGEDGVAVSFTVHDKSGKLPSHEWLSGRTDNDSRFKVSIKGAEDGLNYDATQTAYDAKKGITFTFTSKTYQKYDVVITDPANNISDTYTTDCTKVDEKKPYFTGYSLEKSELEKILNILTFGIYSNDEDVTLTLTAEDAEPSIGIDSIVASYDGTALEEKNTFKTEAKDTAEDGSSKYTATKSFKIPVNNDSSYDPESLEIVVTDSLKNSSSTTLAYLRDNKDVSKNTGDSEFAEIVVTNLEPEVGDYSVSDELKAIKVNDKTIYKGSEGKITTYVADDFAGVDADTLSVKYGIADKTGKAVTDKDAMDGITCETEEGTESGSIKGKVIKSNVTYDVSYLADESGRIPSNAYVFNATAKNYAGNTGGVNKNFTFYVDNTAPVLNEASVTFNAKKEMTEDDWSKDPITVQFEAHDDADGLGFFAGIDASCIKVTGEYYGENLNEEDKTYKVSAVKGKANNYSFKADLKQDYTIVITDKLGNISETYTIDNSRVLFDDEAPVKNGEFLYDGESYSASEWRDAEGVVVSFTVHDKSVKIPTNEWLSGRTDTDNESRFKISVKGVDDGNDYNAKQTAYDEDKGITFEFISYKYQQYDIVITDPANNTSEKYTTDYTKIDTVAPHFTGIKVSKADDTAQKFLHILSFGIYSNDSIKLTVYVADDAPSSGFSEDTAIKAFYDGAEIKEVKKSYSSKDTAKAMEEGMNESTAERAFILDKKDTAYDPKLLEFKVTDVVGNHGETTIDALNSDEKINKDYADFKYTLNEFSELVANGGKPEFSKNITLRENAGVRSYQSTEKLWFSGDVEASFEVTDNLSHLHSVLVDMNKTQINSDSTFKSGDNSEELPTEFSHYLEGESKDIPGSRKISDVEVRFNTSSVSAPVNKLSGNTDGANKITVNAESNNGETETKDTTFYIDDVKPVITGFKFVGDGYDRDTVNTNSADSEPIDDDLVTEAVQETPYGYYFKDTATVYVYASDIVNESNVIGSGIKTIYFKGDSIAQDTQTNSIAVKTATITDDLTGKAYAEFTVPAGFKGRLYAWAEDNVGNFSETKSPDDTIVETDTQNTHSGTNITINTTTNRKDNKGLDLYNGDVTVTFEVWDAYSGIRDIDFTVSEGDPKFKNITSVSEKLEISNTDVNSSTTTLDAWTVSSKEKNIATRLTRQFTIDSKHFDCNNIKVELSAHDRTGREIVKTEKYLSIDITAPEITVTYDPVLSSANSYNGEYYFNVNRTAHITVKERNFNPADFNITKMVALEGSVPALVGGTDWSTSYNDYSDNSTHEATVTFDNDGKYQVDFDFTDMADNVAGEANKHFDVEKFYIDKTNPVIELSIDSTAAGNDRYYNATVTAHITITEHNFATDSTYLIYNCTATGEDNVTSATPPSIGAWSDNGDQHTATITFDADGSYDNLTIEFTDLAKNAAEKKTEPMFYVDTKTKAPVIKEIVNNMAYDGTVTPVVDYDDYNFDNGNYFYTLTRHAYNTELHKSDVNTVATQQSAESDFYRTAAPKQSGVSTGYTGTVVSFSNFLAKESVDGVYTLEAYYIDKATNKSDSTLVTFSVNRFGSVFLLGDTDTEKLIEDHYTSAAPDVVVREINVNPVKEQNVSISYNSSNTDLAQGSEYTITPAASGATSWHEYVYTLAKKNFDKEGEYTVTISSKDEFNNTITNRTANEGRTCPVSFVVDNTPPEITISGVEENGAYREATRTVQIVCMDDNLDKDSLVVKLDDHEFTLEELASYGDFDMVGEVDIALPVDNGKTNNRVHKISVSVSDLAKESNSKEIEKFTLSATLLEMFFRNTVAVVISSVALAGLIGLAIFLILKRRKKNEA